MKKKRTASRISSNEFAEYIDDEQICVKEGVPCHHGIPCCKGCSTSGVEPIIIETPPEIGRDPYIDIFKTMRGSFALIDHWLPTESEDKRDERPKIDVSDLIIPINLKGERNI